MRDHKARAHDFIDPHTIANVSGSISNFLQISYDRPLLILILVWRERDLITHSYLVARINNITRTAGQGVPPCSLDCRASLDIDDFASGSCRIGTTVTSKII